MARYGRGVHPSYHKELASDKSIRRLDAPSSVVVPLQQHIGAPCTPLVKAKEYVVAGQKIGEPGGFVSSPVHASISGTVAAIEPRPHTIGRPTMAVVIEAGEAPEGFEDPLTAREGFEDPLTATPDELKGAISEAGLVGMGGAAFPTHVKLSPPPDSTLDTVVLNGCECEPYLTADHRVMVESTDDVVYGLKVIMRILGVQDGVIAIEGNKPDAVAAMQKAVQGDGNLRVVVLGERYPQGAEKTLINEVLSREVPSGGLPLHVGVVVQNVGTSAAVARAVRDGTPLIERVVTVTGHGVKEPANVLVPIGMSFSEIIDACGGLTENAAKIIGGGPMMGIAQTSLDVPVVKGTSGILVLTEEECRARKVAPCIQCGRCVDACPMGLLPTRLERASERNRMDELERLGAADCVECGCCAYVCPSNRPLVQWIRLGKAEVMAARRRAAA